MLSCQDLSFAGGQRYDCPYSASTSVDGSVDVSTATLVSLWDTGPLDNAARQHEPPRRDSMLVSEHRLGHHTWPDQLSPQLQRNKQLQDTLIQREEELAKLQEENNKLKEFLNSSYVKSLEEKSKKLLSNCKDQDGLSHRKRAHSDFQNLSQLLHGAEGKRTCRNLSLEFCSAEDLADTPPLDSWILETLGLQDENTVDPQQSFNSSMNDHNASLSCAPPKEDHYSTASIGNAVSSNPDARCEYISIIDSPCSLDTSSGYSTSQNLALEYTTLDPSALYTVTPTGSLVSSSTVMTPAQHFTPPRAASTPYRPHDVSPGSYYHKPGCESSSPQGGDSQIFSTPCMSRSRTDLAFSMSLSPQNSVKTHSFPQGQAFTRKDAQGGWKFTWVPKQCS
ncbi:Geminin coiled-coil domain-containing protein 1 [Triplophysa tibetana]|uniref:Geminin coiled-coil domain-containing protein 1 n=1 Tax=Triplophysa tibetana TaxID=1572043 RepID=A0A5A9MWJ9_9TELE|nr:Geminin coiled-coil domain-containing protein 1 [Triplophysa tibetana]